MAQDADVILAGGGLSAGLIALALKRARPDLKILIFEKAADPSDRHTWSFFASDLSAEQRALVEPIIETAWNDYEVRFPSYGRRLTTPYASASEARLQEALARALGPDLRRGAGVRDVGPERVIRDDGTVVNAPLVIDARGPVATPSLSLAWQKFLGLEIVTERPHGIERPMVMDAALPQHDGYRFVYLLPFAADRVLVEDTYYSDGPALEPRALEARILAEVERRRLGPFTVRRRERGVLPIALGGAVEPLFAHQPDLPRVGLRAALFHPTTGYSLPDAAALALEIARAPSLKSAAIARLARERAARLWRERGFYRALNRMMFLAARPGRRRDVLERFYRLPQPLIERFYAGASTLADRARILSGKPPVPVLAALRALPEASASSRRTALV